MNSVELCSMVIYKLIMVIYTKIKFLQKADKMVKNMNEKEKQNYRNILLECHKENKDFNDKVISTFCAASIPFLLTLSKDLNLFNNMVFSFFLMSLLIFTFTFLFQIINSILAMKGCDKGLQEKYSLSNWFFDKTDKIEIGIIISFVVAIVFTFLTFYIDFSIKKEIYVQDKIKSEIRKETKKMTNEKEKQQIPKPQKEFWNAPTPNKNIRPNPTPPTPKENK